MRDDTSIVSNITIIVSHVTSVMSDVRIIIRYDDNFALVSKLDLFDYLALLG